MSLLLALFGWVVISNAKLQSLRVSADEVKCKSHETWDGQHDCARFLVLCGDSFLSAYKQLCAKRKRQLKTTKDNLGNTCTLTTTDDDDNDNNKAIKPV